jgi:N-formylglutamate amidohydrolase
MMDYARVLEGHLIEQMAADEIARQERMRAAWKAYHGDMPKPLKVAAGQPDDNVIVAKARTIVDASTARFTGGQVNE